MLEEQSGLLGLLTIQPQYGPVLGNSGVNHNVDDSYASANADSDENESDARTDTLSEFVSYKLLSGYDKEDKLHSTELELKAHLFKSDQEEEVPDMWSLDYIGLYSQYAAIGLLYGSSGALVGLCHYVYEGSPNLCANSMNIQNLAWSFKIVFAVVTERIRPFGLRRKPWMVGGWLMVLLLLLFLTIRADTLEAPMWLATLMVIQVFVMFADVPADGYCIELGMIEPPHRRGKIVATSQMIRFLFCVLAGLFQAVLLNGRTTNKQDCHLSFGGCWSFGLGINHYYGLLFSIVLVLCIPLIWLKERDPSKIPRHSLKQFGMSLWDTLQNLTTFRLMVFVVGTHCLTNFKSTANTYVQYYVIKLTNFQAGVDTMTTYLALALAIWVFKRYLLHKDWRISQYASTLGSAFVGFIWLSVFYNIGGLMNGWFTVFIDIDQKFVQGITQVLFSITVIELSKPGLEATTYELLMTVANAGLQVAGIVAVQLLTAFQASACTDPTTTEPCPPDSVNVSSYDAYVQTDGPWRFTKYTLALQACNIVFCFVFTPFLPKSRAQCDEWKILGEKSGKSFERGVFAAMLCVGTIIYGFSAAMLLLFPSTSCLAIVGGPGC